MDKINSSFVILMLFNHCCALISDHPRIPPPYCSNSFTDPNEIAKVDKINLRVKCAGKTMEVDMFPLEKISVLLEEACEWYGKKPEKMSLVYAGKQHIHCS